MRMINIALLLTLVLGLMAGLGFLQPTSTRVNETMQKTDANNTIHASTEPTIQVIFVVRHGDTNANAGQNPNLNTAGALRAQRLATMLQAESIDAIYITKTNRSSQTAAPTANAAGIEPTTYPPLDAQALANVIVGSPANEEILVVAHSNTVPMIINALGGPALEDLEETSFDHAYAVVLRNGNHVRTIQLRY